MSQATGGVIAFPYGQAGSPNLNLNVGSAPLVRVAVTAAKAASGNVLAVNVNPDLRRFLVLLPGAEARRRRCLGDPAHRLQE